MEKVILLQLGPAAITIKHDQTQFNKSWPWLNHEHTYHELLMIKTKPSNPSKFRTCLPIIENVNIFFFNTAREGGDLEGEGEKY